MAKPCGMNGCRLAESNAGSATATNTPSAMIFSTTRIALSVALSLVPSIRPPATTQVMITAGRLNTPPSTCGPADRANGSRMSMPVLPCIHSRKPTK
ncbi:hypothetical protein D9M71_818360 [compost metagenome]